MTGRSTLRLGSALLLAGVFAWSGVAKAMDPQVFIETVDRFRLIQGLPMEALGWYLPWLEISTAIGLLIPRWRVPAAWVSGGLLVVFIAALASAQVRGLNLDCGCFGRAEDATDLTWPLVRDVVLLALAVLVAVPPTRPLPIASAATPSEPTPSPTRSQQLPGCPS